MIWLFLTYFTFNLSLFHIVLKIDPNHIDGLKCKALTLLHLSRFEEVLETAKDHPELAFEKAYSFYKLYKFAEAHEVLQTIQNPPPNVMFLDAQLSFRMENYQRAVELYEQLYKMQPDSDEIRSNLLAAYSMYRPWAAAVLPMARGQKQDSYESLYNIACCEVSLGHYYRALNLLQQAEDGCRQINEDDEENFENDVAIIHCQKAYVLGRLGQVKEAQQIFEHLIKIRPSDQAVLAVACSNNAVLLGGHCTELDIRKVGTSLSLCLFVIPLF